MNNAYFDCIYPKLVWIESRSCRHLSFGSLDAATENKLILREGGEGGVMIPFHAQILTKFKRHVQF